MITLDLKAESSKTASSSLNVLASQEEPTTSFSQLLKNTQLDTEKTDSKAQDPLKNSDTQESDTKLVKSTGLVLALDEDTIEKPQAKTSSKLDTLSQLLKSPQISEQDFKEIDPKILNGMKETEFKALVSNAKDFLKLQILQSDDYKLAQVKELPQTLKGLVDFASKLKIDLQKIKIEEIGAKKETTVPKFFESIKDTTSNIFAMKQTKDSKNSVKELETPLGKILKSDVKESSKTENKPELKAQTPLDAKVVKEDIKTDLKQESSKTELKAQTPLDTKAVKEDIKTELPKAEIKAQTPLDTKATKEDIKTELPKAELKTDTKTENKTELKAQTPLDAKFVKEDIKTELPKADIKTENKTELKAQTPLDTKSVKEDIKTELPKAELKTDTKTELKAQTPLDTKAVKEDIKTDLKQETKATQFEKQVTQQTNELKTTPMAKAQTNFEYSTQEIISKRQIKTDDKTPKSRANETLQSLLRGEKPSQINPSFTADFSVETARVIAPSATTEVTKNLESLLHGDKTETNTNSKIDGLNVNKADSFEVKLNEAKQMIKYISQDVKTAIEDYKSPFTRIKLQLNPQKLGQVDLTVVQRGQNLHVNISSNNAAINTLALNANELRTQLNNNGINNATLNFNNQPQGDGSSSGQQRQNEREAHQAYNYYESEEENEEILDSLEIIVPSYV